MKTLTSGLKTLLSLCFALIFFAASNPASAELTNKERNILANEAKAIDLAKVLITDNSWNKLPDYKNRQFWQNLPANIRQEYITKAEAYLAYNWPVVKATDYLEFIRFGDRRQGVYLACSNALITLVMGELVEGKGRFMDQIINAVWYYSEQTWWGWSAHLYFQESSPGLPDINDPTVDLGVGEVTNNLSWTWYLFKDEFDGDGFSLNMSYNPKVVTPKIEFIEVTDRSLKRYWPNGVTRVVLEFINPGLKGGQVVTFTPTK